MHEGKGFTMNTLLARPRVSPRRTFPLPDPRIATEGDVIPGTKSVDALRIFEALSTRPLTFRQRYLRWGLSPTDRLTLLLVKHRMAVDAEIASQWRRADFLWDEVLAEAKRVIGDEQCWTEIAGTFEQGARGASPSAVSRLRNAFVEEVLIDTHCAFFNGRFKDVEIPDFADRAFVHVARVETLLGLSVMSKADQFQMMRAIEELRINALADGRRWDEAIRLCESLLKRSGGNELYQNRLVELHSGKMMDCLSEGNSSTENAADAAELKSGIDALLKLHRTYPDNVMVFELLAQFFHLRAVKLANYGLVAEALVDIQKALAFRPGFEEAVETRNQLVELMKTLQKRVGELKEELDKRPDATLTSDGIQMLHEAAVGFSQVNSYVNSAEPDETSQARRTAEAKSLWKNIGLQEPAEHWSEQAQELFGAIADVAATPPTTIGELGRCWEHAIAKRPELTGIDSSAVCAFLQQRWFGEGPAPETRKPPEKKGIPLFLTVNPSDHRRDGEPFWFWLFNRADLRLKVQCAVAIILLVTAGTLAVSDAIARHGRESGYQQVLEGVNSRNPLEIVKGAEEYFDSVPLSGGDGRDSVLADLYDKAFVQWFSTQGAGENPESQDHIARYREVIASHGTGGNKP
jgi:hypothetical protein